MERMTFWSTAVLLLVLGCGTSRNPGHDATRGDDAGAINPGNNGGAAGSAGLTASGGVAGSLSAGGAEAAGTGGAVGGSGAAAGNAGAPGSGGVAGSAGAPNSGGVAGSGGRNEPPDAAAPGDAGMCPPGGCTQGPCPAGEHYCEGDQLRRCHDNGIEYTLVENCGATRYCAEGACHERRCSPGSPTCDGNVATTCNAVGSDFTGSRTTCTGYQLCAAGSCQNPRFIDDFEQDTIDLWERRQLRVDPVTLSRGITSDVAAGGTAQSLETWGIGSISEAVSLERAFEDGVVATTVRFWARAEDTSGIWLVELVQMYSQIAPEIVAGVGFGKDGRFGARGRGLAPGETVELSEYQTDRWYEFQLTVNLEAGTFDVYIDGSLEASQLEIYRYTPNGVRIRYDVGVPSSVSRTWWDEITVY